MKTTVGVIIGRFQVPELTPAHRAAIKAVEKDGNDLTTILLGISPNDGRSAENPLTYVQRRNHFPATVDVFPLPNKPTNAEWSIQVDTLLASVYPPDRYTVTLYGGRKSFREAYEGNYPTKDVKIDIPVSGTETRASIKEAETPAFLLGQIYALQTQYAHVYPTVDTIVWRVRPDLGDGGQIVVARDIQVLLIQRADNDEWGFIGGFVDPSDASFAAAARREVFEEVGITAESGVRCVGSARVADWRYRGTRDTIMTTLFTLQYAFGTVTPNPDEVQDYQWVPFGDVAKHLSATHSPLWKTAEPEFVEQLGGR
jgi:bifunctional NMN adenylyltransferase/nudix hydrolase